MSQKQIGVPDSACYVFIIIYYYLLLLLLLLYLGITMTHCVLFPSPLLLSLLRQGHTVQHRLGWKSGCPRLSPAL